MIPKGPLTAFWLIRQNSRPQRRRTAGYLTCFKQGQQFYLTFLENIWGRNKVLPKVMYMVHCYFKIKYLHTKGITMLRSLLAWRCHLFIPICSPHFCPYSLCTWQGFQPSPSPSYLLVSSVSSTLHCDPSQGVLWIHWLCPLFCLDFLPFISPQHTHVSFSDAAPLNKCSLIIVYKTENHLAHSAHFPFLLYLLHNYCYRKVFLLLQLASLCLNINSTLCVVYQRHYSIFPG